MDRRKLAGDDRDRFGRLRRRGQRIEERVGEGRCRIRPQRPRRELHVVLGQARNAERVMDQHLVVALRDAHRRQDRAGRIRAHQQVDLVHRDQLLVQRPRQVGLRLVVLDDIFDRAAEQPVLLVDLRDEDVGDQLMDDAGRSERTGQRQRAADADRRARWRGAGRAGAEHDTNGQQGKRPSEAMNDAHGNLLRFKAPPGERGAAPRIRDAGFAPRCGDVCLRSSPVRSTVSCSCERRSRG